MVHHHYLMFYIQCHQSLQSISLPLHWYLTFPIAINPLHLALPLSPLTQLFWRYWTFLMVYSPFLVKLSTITMFSLITIRRSTFLEERHFLFAIVTILPLVLVYGIHIYPYIHKNSLLSGEQREKKLLEMVQLSFAYFKSYYLVILNFSHFTMIKLMLGFSFEHTITLSIFLQKVYKVCKRKTWYKLSNLSA